MLYILVDSDSEIAELMIIRGREIIHTYHWSNKTEISLGLQVLLSKLEDSKEAYKWVKSKTSTQLLTTDENYIDLCTWKWALESILSSSTYIDQYVEKYHLSGELNNQYNVKLFMVLQELSQYCKKFLIVSLI